MGTGRYKDGKFDLTVVANFEMDSDEWAQWERALKKASEILFNASEGQLQFGRLFVCDQSIGINTADIILHQTGRISSSSIGDFGELGAAVNLAQIARFQVASIIHELGHNVWGLFDEYTRPSIDEAIDMERLTSDYATIPIEDNGRADNEYTNLNAEVYLVFEDSIERKGIVADTSTSITVEEPFSRSPGDDRNGEATVQIPAECAEGSFPNYCIMQTSRGAVGSFDWAGNWSEISYPITEFCTASNHDPDGDTAQEAEHGKSCWEVIGEHQDFAGLTVPDPASGEPTTGAEETDWVILDKQPRFALVLDRSYSMRTGHKMDNARHGALYWIDYCALADDQLSVIWYNHEFETVLEMTTVDEIPDLSTVTDEIRDLEPGGTTNIRDALQEGLRQIHSVNGRAAVQVALLLTDGKHNTPEGSDAREVLPSLQDAGVRIYAIGAGSSDVVDMDCLKDLADGTGGKAYPVGDNELESITTTMLEINALVRGGIITTSPELFPDAPEEATGKTPWWAEGDRPNLAELCKRLEIKFPEQVIHPPPAIAAWISANPVDVEKECERASFTLTYPDKEDLWLYLIDPDGKAVDMKSGDVRHVISDAPYEFAVVEQPKAGRWHIVAVRPQIGTSFRYHVLAGSENRNLQVFGGATPSNPAGTPVRVWASARWLNELSNLSVMVTVIAPNGVRRRVRLHDDAGEKNSGRYEGFVQLPEEGRHTGHIVIHSRGDAIIARPHTRLLDSEEKVLPLHAGAPKFIRIIPFYFDSGERPTVKDDEAKIFSSNL